MKDVMKQERSDLTNVAEEIKKSGSSNYVKDIEVESWGKTEENVI